MTRVPFRGIFAGIAGAWLATLGACGRTAPTLDDTFGYGDDDTALTGGAGGARGGATSTGGSTRGGSTSTGGSVNAGGASGTGAGAGPARGGSSVGGTGVGGTVAVGGSFAVGGSVGLGGTTGRGGSSGSSAGGTTSNGGSGAQGGTGTMTFISCGDEACDPNTSVCCSRRSQPSYCVAPGADCPGVTLTCSGPGQCAAGEVCCFHAPSSFCTAECEVSQGERGNPPTIVLCDSSPDCGPNETCVLAPRGIAYCGENL